MGYKHTFTESEFRAAVAGSSSVAAVLKELGMSDCGGNRATVRAHIDQWAVPISHFKGQGWRRGGSSATDPRITSKYGVHNLIKGSTLASSNVRDIVLKHRLLPYECAACGISEWRGYPLTLEIDHIDGDGSNNELENLRFLCPNCHSQTPTAKGRNIRPTVRVSDDELAEAISTSPNVRQALIKAGLTPKGGNYYRVYELMGSRGLSFAT